MSTLLSATRKNSQTGPILLFWGKGHLIDCIESTSTPKSVEGGASASDANHYGSLAFLRYHDPLDRIVTLLKCEVAISCIIITTLDPSHCKLHPISTMIV